MTDKEAITEAVKAKYRAVATGKTRTCCDPGASGGSDGLVNISLGYKDTDLAEIPEGAELGLGCGNPTGVAEINPGEIVVDLGSGAGVDCFLAARKVGERGVVIGVDMTEEMVERAMANAKRGNFSNVQFRLGRIDDIPVEANFSDLVISNCVINLAPDKASVFREIYRILRPGGRFCVSDVVSRGNIPDHVRQDMEQWAGCISGALDKDEYLQIIKNAGFEPPMVLSEVDYDYGKSEGYALASLTVQAYKPGSNGHNHR
jgi:SAM-dependent methyltransferase